MLIIDYDLDIANFVLPTVEDDDDWEQVMHNLGDYTILEIDYITENFTKVLIDYSLHEFKNLKEAKAELNAVCKYVKQYFGIKGKVDQAKWNQESKQFLTEHKQQSVDFHKNSLQEVIAGGPEQTYHTGSWCDPKATVESDCVDIKWSKKQNDSGQNWAVKTIKRYKSQQAFDQHTAEMKNKIAQLESELKQLKTA